LQCPRCGRPYCDQHGEEFCDVCLEPASALPSFTLYRGSLLALLIGTALAVYLILQPPGGETTAFTPVAISPTAGAAGNQTPQAQPTARPAGTPATPGAGTTPGAGATPGAGGAGTATPPAGTGTHTVQSGDSLSGICGARPANMSLQECVDRVVQLNNLSSPNDLRIGQTLTVPR
jgi:nucleoid-associated protein YgaU